MLNIYCDGVFDLFHIGHLNHFKKITEYFNTPINLIVGVISDKSAEVYKRKPIFNEKKRMKILSACKYVNKVILINNLIIDEILLNKHSINYVIHAFSNKKDLDKQQKFYKIPIQLNKFITIEYNHGISTTQIINDNNLNWNNIWEKKGTENTTNLYLLNGWEKTDFDPQSLITKIISTLNIKLNENIIEIGCGSGLLSTFLKDFDYIGIDKSLSLINKNVKLLNNITLNFDSITSIFKEKYFDYCICNSMLEYLNNIDELNKTIDEIEKITKKGIYIGCIRYKTHENKKNKHKYNGIFKHMVIPKQYFLDRGYTITESVYDNNERYDAFKHIQT